MSEERARTDARDRRHAGRSVSPLLLDLVRVLARQTAREARSSEFASPGDDKEIINDVEDCEP